MRISSVFSYNVLSRLMLVLTVFGFFGANMAFSQSSTPNTAISTALCGVYHIINTVVFIIGLVLVVLGGVMYAAAHVLPGNLKGSLQGYGMGMIVGGIAGVIIALSAGYIIGVISGNSAITASSLCPSTT